MTKTLCKICLGACCPWGNGEFIHDRAVEHNLRRYHMEHMADPMSPAELLAHQNAKDKQRIDATFNAAVRTVNWVRNRVRFGIIFPL